MEHTFGTTRSWRREFTINEFLIYSNKLDIILKNVIENGISISSTNKGYMQGLKGFANVVTKIRHKLSQKRLINKEDTWAVDIDYSSLPIIEQIQEKVVSAITRIRTPVLNIMKVFGMEQLSLYCNEISSIKDLCNILYQSSSRRQPNILGNEVQLSEPTKVNTEDIIQRLSKLALEFNNGNGSEIP